MLTNRTFGFKMSQIERGLIVVKIAHSVHEKDLENTVWRAGERAANSHRNEPGSLCRSMRVCEKLYESH